MRPSKQRYLGRNPQNLIQTASQKPTEAAFIQSNQANNSRNEVSVSTILDDPHIRGEVVSKTQLQPQKQFGSSGPAPNKRLELSLAQEILSREAAEAKVKGLLSALGNNANSQNNNSNRDTCNSVSTRLEHTDCHCNCHSQQSIKLRSLVSDRSLQRDFEQEYSKKESSIGVKILEENNRQLQEQLEQLQETNRHLCREVETLRQTNEEANTNLTLAISTLEGLRQPDSRDTDSQESVSILRGQLEAVQDELESQRHKVKVGKEVSYLDAHWRKQPT